MRVEVGAEGETSGLTWDLGVLQRMWWESSRAEGHKDVSRDCALLFLFQPWFPVRSPSLAYFIFSSIGISSVSTRLRAISPGGSEHLIQPQASPTLPAQTLPQQSLQNPYGDNNVTHIRNQGALAGGAQRGISVRSH